VESESLLDAVRRVARELTARDRAPDADPVPARAARRAG
jgi:hypothetical protein